MKTSHSTVSNKFLSSRNDGNRLEDLSRGLDYFNDEFDSNSIATILTVTKKSSDNVSGKIHNSANKKTSSFISKSQLAQPSLEKWSSVFNKNAPNNNMSINRKPNIQFSTSINGTSLTSNELTILPKIGSNATTNETSHHTKHQTTSDSKVQLLPLSEQSIKRIRALLKLDQEYTAPPVPSRASPPRRRVPKRNGCGWTLQTPYYTSSSTSSSSSQTQNDLMVLKASPMRNGPPTTHKSTTPSFSSSSSSTSSSNAVSRRQVNPPQPPISSYQYPFYANSNGGRMGIEDEYLVMAVPPSTPLLQNSLEDSVIIEECCYICQHEHHNHNHHHYQKQPHSNSNNFKKIDKNNRVLVPKVSSSLISLNRKQFI